MLDLLFALDALMLSIPNDLVNVRMDSKSAVECLSSGYPCKRLLSILIESTGRGPE